MKVKNLLLRVSEWLRRRVTALKDTRSVYVNVNDDVNDFVIDTWLLSLRNRKLACISLVCTSVDCLPDGWLSLTLSLI